MREARGKKRRERQGCKRLLGRRAMCVGAGEGKGVDGGCDVVGGGARWCEVEQLPPTSVRTLLVQPVESVAKATLVRTHPQGARRKTQRSGATGQEAGQGKGVRKSR